jgi:hypothetical protein
MDALALVSFSRSRPGTFSAPLPWMGLPHFKPWADIELGEKLKITKKYAKISGNLLPY